MSMVNKKTVKKAGSGRDNFLLTEKAPFVMQEAYKSLRTNIMLSLPGTECKCIGVTSPTPGDGKSTTATNLAITLAQIGKRVLLIDSDMRLPSVAGRFRITATPGLSDFLVGEARIEDVVRNLEKHGIQVLPAGSIPPDPTGLLESKQMNHLITALRNIYDFVVIDLPPVTTVPDAVILSKYLDGYLLVARENRTEHRRVAEMLRQLQMADAKILGFVTTGGTVGSGNYYRR